MTIPDVPFEEAEPIVPGYRIFHRAATDHLSHWFEAEEESGRRRVMLRMLRPGLAGDEGACQAFVADTDRAAALSHPNLLSVLATGGGETPHVVTEAGIHTLAAELSSGWPLGAAVALGYAHDLASALAYLEEEGLVHRNLAPSLVHLDAGERASLLPLGEVVPVKTLAAQRGRLSQDPRYAAPELIAGSDPIDGRTASYVLAGLLFHMLSGAPPHPGPTPLEMVRGHLREEFPPLEEARPDVAPAVAELCRDCTRRDIAHRPGLQQLARALETARRQAARAAPPTPRRDA